MVEPISFLSNVRVASPCFQSWEMMEGDDHSRFCKECKHDVFNLSEMTKDEAEALLSSHTGRLCIRYYQRRDGTVMTKDCPVGAKAVSAEQWRKRRAFIAIAGTLGLIGARSVLALLSSMAQPDLVPALGGNSEPIKCGTPLETMEQVEKKSGYHENGKVKIGLYSDPKEILRTIKVKP